MAKKNYSDLLKDPRWQKKRLEILSRDEFKCVLCKSGKTTLHVHHKEYHAKKQPWDYPNEILITLCEHCHTFIEICKTHKSKYQIGSPLLKFATNESVIFFYSTPNSPFAFVELSNGTITASSNFNMLASEMILKQLSKAIENGKTIH